MHKPWEDNPVTVLESEGQDTLVRVAILFGSR
jgi:hypothetical protein